MSYLDIVRLRQKNLGVPRSPTRHERDQSFLVPVPVRKKMLVPVPSETNFSANPSQRYFGLGPGKKKILVP
jgi:hypothetical protein